MLDLETMDALSQAFPPSQCSKRRGPGGRDLTYVDQHSVISRLNEAAGIGGWRWALHHCVIQDGLVMVAGSLLIGDSRHDGCSMEPLDGKRDPEMVIKIADTDALKRAARLYGVGLHLYDKFDDIHKSTTRRGPHTPRAEQGNKGGPPTASAKQKDLIMKLCSERGMTPLEVDTRIEKKFSGKTLSTLDIVQAKEIIGSLLG